MRADGDDRPAEPTLRSMPPAVRPADLRPMQTQWKVDGRFLRIGEMTGAQMRTVATRAWRLALGNERTGRYFDAISQDVGDNQRADDVLNDDRAYAIAVGVLGEEAALSLLGRRKTDVVPAR